VAECVWQTGAGLALARVSEISVLMEQLAAAAQLAEEAGWSPAQLVFAVAELALGSSTAQALVVAAAAVVVEVVGAAVAGCAGLAAGLGSHDAAVAGAEDGVAGEGSDSRAGHCAIATDQAAAGNEVAGFGTKGD
jgi:hypothetical protein